MKFSKKWVSSALTISMLLTCFAPVPAKAAGDACEVDSEASFRAALDDPNVSRITIVKNFYFQRPSSDEVFIIPEHNQPLVITANPEVNLSFSHAGIILGGDTTFQDIQLTFANSVRNAIIANGHTLTLENVKPSGSKWRTHLFCGGITDYSSTGTLPTTGNHGKVILLGNNEVGDIFAGSMSDVKNGDAESPNHFDYPATIDIQQNSNGKIGTIYGCGARENRSGGYGDDWIIDANKYQSKDTVTIKLNGSGVRQIDGDTGTSTAANVIYEDSKGYLNNRLQLENISGLNVQSGKLEPQARSTFFGDDASVEIGSGAQLNLKNMNDVLTLGDFTGGGVLILGEDQQISLNGKVSGTTKIAVGDINFQGTNSEGTPQEGYTYLGAPQSRDDTFKLLPNKREPDLELIRNAQGYWSVGKSDMGEKKILIQDISMPATFTANDDIQALIPVTVQYASNSLQGLEFLPFQARQSDSGNYVQAQADTNDIYFCTVPINGVELKLSFGTYDVGGQTVECFLVESNESQTIPAGDYEFNILIPQDKMEGALQDKTLSTRVTIPNTSQPEPAPLHKIPRPIANTNLIYNGQEQVGVPSGSGYTLSEYQKTQAGKYRATAVLADGFQWDDGGMASMEIDWEITPAPLAIDSVVLEPKTYDGSTVARVADVKLSGVLPSETLQFHTDYTASAEFMNPNVGTNKTVQVIVKLTSSVQNYTLPNTAFQLTGQTILPQNGAAAPNVSGAYTVSTKYPGCFLYTVHPIQGAEYKMDSGAWQSDNTFDNITPLSTHTFYVRIKQTANQAAGAAGDSGAILFQKLDNTHVPRLKPMLSGTNGNRTITIQPVNGAEYSFDGGSKYDSDNRKDGCSGTVQVAIRYAETATHNASQAVTQNVNTDKQAQEALFIEAVGNKTYGDEPFTLTASGGSGVGAVRFASSDNDTLSIDGSTAVIKKSGSVDIIATKEEDARYNETSTTLPVTINKKALTVKANEQSVALGGAMPELTFHVDGLVNGDTFISPALTTTAKDTNTSGVFDIIVSGGVLTNPESYTITYLNGSLTVSSQLYPLTVVGGSGSTRYQEGQTVTITADTREGYAFTEWTGDAGIVFADSKAKTTTFLMPGKPVTVTANYKIVNTGDNTSSGGSSSGSSSNNSGSTSSNKTEVRKNSDGSTTEIVKKFNGTVIESTKNADGSKTVVEKQQDGTVIALETTKQGDRTETVTKKDGSRLIQVKQKNGAAAVVAVAPSGKTDAQIRFSEKSMTENKERALMLPIPSVSVPHDESQAPTIQVETEKAKEVVVTVPLNSTNPGVVAALVDANGTHHILQKSLMQKDGITVALKTPATIQLVDKSKVFTDVSPTYWAKDSITFVTARGIYGGASGSTFEPEAHMTRGMLVKVLHNLENQPKASNEKRFSDVKSNAWYAQAVYWATEKGIINGTEQNRFEPNQAITREQLAVILYRYMEQPASGSQVLHFQDMDSASGYAHTALNWAVEQGIIQGEEGNILNPKSSLNRAECAAILMRCLQTQAR